MKKVFSKTALLILFIFSAAFLSDAFFCEDNQTSTAQTPAHCCVQCCPAHNLMTPSSGVAQILPAHIINSFVVENLDIQIEIHPSRIERPPIV